MTKFDSMLSETVISTKSNHQGVIDCGENLCTVVFEKVTLIGAGQIL